MCCATHHLLVLDFGQREYFWSEVRKEGETKLRFKTDYDKTSTRCLNKKSWNIMVCKMAMSTWWNYNKTHCNVKWACGEVKYPCGANSIDCHVWECVWMVTQGQWSQVDKWCAVNRLLGDRIWYGDRGPRKTQKLAELAEGTYTWWYDETTICLWQCPGRTETETELTCDTEHNSTCQGNLQAKRRWGL